ncbi:hypothetical protein BSPWISOXPB_11005 [uncultured Gammaproteobacteria bacterium]|nr:hypothetical protein BSPWISOXPB_3736 [uncultured Gammaproteobacteria bacterium]VVM23009.1 hypothetical protein BSPWISOXPB_1803 [uncultured Gammaproteobacteria bacterium]VVM28444.1 hypothetical protein BSPWISOXPB_11005 [uncultured Gammaproteobacteria bacterium]
MNKKYIVVFSFVIMFFTMHPTYRLCSEKCLMQALLLAIIFSYCNLNIYKFIKGEEFDEFSESAYTLPSLSIDNSIKNKIFRLFWFSSFVIVNLIILYFSFKLSWLFN